MDIKNRIVPISEIQQRKLAVVYGKSGSGKTTLGATFPKPLLHVKIGDDGRASIADVPNIFTISVNKIADLTEIIEYVDNSDEYKTVLYDTFSLIVEMWKSENILNRKKKTEKVEIPRMSQQAWGDLMNVTNDFIRSFVRQSEDRWVVVTGHEVLETLPGLEEELLPDGRIAIGKGSRNYLEGMANLGLHTVKLNKEVQLSDGTVETKVRYAAEIGPSAFYWTKTQTVKSVKIPRRIINPTYDKIMEKLN